MEEYTPNTTETSGGKKTAKKITYYVVMAIATALFIAAIITLCITFFGSRDFPTDDYTNTSSITENGLPVNPINFDKLQSDYPDACAWIKIPGIEEIDLPIFQSATDVDDNFYLDHNRDGNSDRYGEIYIQKRNHKDFSDPNTLIYGHNMRNGDMFGKLYDGTSKQFCDKDYFDTYRTILVYTPGHIYKYEIISAFVYDNRHIINSFNFSVEEDRMEFFNECINPTSLTRQVLEGATLEADDKIVTLSTCTGNNNTRFLVVGKLLSDTKTAE